MLDQTGLPFENADTAISGIRSSTLGTSSKGRRLVTMDLRSNAPLRISSMSALSHSRTTQSKKRRQSRGNDLA